LPLLLMGLTLTILLVLALWNLRSDRQVASSITEDGYLALTITRNIALGRGVSADGEHLTNGFQPLIVFLRTPFYLPYAEDRYTPLRWVFALDLLMLVISAGLLGLIVRDGLALRDERERRTIFWLSAFLMISSVFVWLQYFNGLETGLVILLYLACWRWYQTRGAANVGAALGLGVLFGFLILARIDSGVVMAVFLLFLLIAAVRKGNWRGGLRSAVLVALPALLISSPWWIFNQTQFGSVMPISGQVLTEGGSSIHRTLWTERVGYAIDAVLQAGLPAIYARDFAGDLPNVLGVSALLLVLAGLWAARLPIVLMLGAVTMWKRKSLFVSQSDDEPADALLKRERTLFFALCLLTGMIALVIWYTLRLYSFWYYPRYFAPLLLISLPLAACVGLLLYRRLPILLFILITTLAGFAFIFALATLAGRTLDYRFMTLVDMVEANTPPDAPVAAWETGTLGYFRDGVINLDGKVNADVIPYVGSPWEYLNNADIRYVAWFHEATMPPVLIAFGEHIEADGWGVIAEIPFKGYTLLGR